MDPYAWTLVKQAAAWGLAAGVVVALVYFAIEYPKLQYALTLNMTPPQVP